MGISYVYLDNEIIILDNDNQIGCVFESLGSLKYRIDNVFEKEKILEQAIKLFHKLQGK